MHVRGWGGKTVVINLVMTPTRWVLVTSVKFRFQVKNINEIDAGRCWIFALVVIQR